MAAYFAGRLIDGSRRNMEAEWAEISPRAVQARRDLEDQRLFEDPAEIREDDFEEK